MASINSREVFGLSEELIRRRYSGSNIKAVLDGNCRRLLGDTWKESSAPTGDARGEER